MEMDRKKAQKLFDKYRNGQCSPEEEMLLEAFLESYQQDSLWDGDLGDKESLDSEMWSSFQSRVTKENKAKGYRVLLKVAAAIAILIGLYGLGEWWLRPQPELQFPEHSIVLTTEDGIIPLDDRQFKKVLDFNALGKATQHKNSLTYESGLVSEELSYNELSIPHGKTFELELSDGTKVRLNSGSSIRFPVKFHQKGQRKVSIKGEAYLDVAHDAERPFVLDVDGMEIEVLGTSFGVNTFAKDPYVVLVEGKVQVSGADTQEPLELYPGEMAAITSNGLEKQVVDPQDYLDWTHGIFRFRDLAFTDILSGIERKYNVDVVNDFVAMDHTRFSGRFTDEDIYEVMELFRESVGFEYHIADNKIHIYNPKNN